MRWSRGSVVFLRLTGIATGSVIVAGCLGGCGSTAPTKRLDSQEYLQQIREIAAGDDAGKASRLFVEIVVDPPLPQPSCLARTRDFQQALDRTIASVEQLSPPADMAQLQRQFVAAARESIGTVEQAVNNIGAGKLHCGTSLNRRIYGLPSTLRAEAVLREYAKRGYIFGLNSQD